MTRGRSFIDEQRAGPYKFWQHRHLLERDGEGTRMTDDIHYAMRFDPLGRIAHAVHVRPLMERMFAHRREALEKRFNQVTT